MVHGAIVICSSQFIAMFFKIGVRAVNKLFFSWPVFVRQSSKLLGHVESMLKISWDLTVLWKGVGTKLSKTAVFLLRI